MAETEQAFVPNTDWMRRFRRRLLRWFAADQRDLPWRKTDDLYAIWISEIMLQQTQVETVIPYFQRFLDAFPTVESLAQAPESEVLRQWEGLGYYRRARLLHRAAIQIVNEHAGVFPRRFDEVLGLPGIGRYTAGAILSIGLDQPHPIVEANTLRLYSRLLLLREDPRKAAGQRRLWQFAEQLLPRKGAGQLNQAMMELGSEICTPKQPGCDHCPVAALCPALQHGLQTELPLPARPIQYQEVVETAVVVRHESKVLLRQCEHDERWAGMWDFLRFEVGSQRAPTMAQVRQGAKRLSGAAIVSPQQLATIDYGVTRFRIRLHVYEAELRQGAEVGAESALQWASESDLEQLPLSVTGRRICRLLRFPDRKQQRT